MILNIKMAIRNPKESLKTFMRHKSFIQMMYKATAVFLTQSNQDATMQYLAMIVFTMAQAFLVI